MARKKNRRGGFTLIELVTVVALLGILSALAVASFSGMKTAVASDTAEKQLSTIQDAYLYTRTTGSSDPAADMADLLPDTLKDSYTLTTDGEEYTITLTLDGTAYTRTGTVPTS